MALRMLLLITIITTSASVLADNNSDPPDPGLLEFLGRIAGLESMGIDIDSLLAESLEDSLQPKEKDDDDQS